MRVRAKPERSAHVRSATRPPPPPLDRARGLLGAELGARGDEFSTGPDQSTTLENTNEEGLEDQGDLDDLQDDATEEDIAEAPNDDDSTAFFDDPTSLVDEAVTVSGEIVEVLSPHTFVMGRGDQATVVTRSDPDGVTLLPGHTAQVTGTVGTFVLFEVGKDGPYIAARDVNMLNED